MLDKHLWMGKKPRPGSLRLAIDRTLPSADLASPVGSRGLFHS